mgnify:CR=1 FL=1
MAVKMRLRRMGSRNSPFYRVVVQDARRAPTGRFIETIGWYDPKQDGSNFSINLERVEYWKSNGAQPSETVKSLIKKANMQPKDESVSGSITEKEIPEELFKDETKEDLINEDDNVSTEESSEETTEESSEADDKSDSWRIY